MLNLRAEKEIIDSWKKGEERPLVSVCCLTYNHERYIEDAIRGFLIQETDFPIEIIIHDDASTDRTQEIIQEYCDAYPKLFKVILQKSNQLSQGIHPGFQFLFPLASGKYIAICEGDDYWMAPDKLSNQTMILETNPKVSISIHNAILYNIQENKTRNFNAKKMPEIMGTADLITRSWFAPTASIFYRNTNIGKPNSAINADIYLLLELSMRGLIHYNEKACSVYRFLSYGSLSEASRSTDRLSIFMKKLSFLSYVDKRTKYKYIHRTAAARIKVIISLIKYSLFQFIGR